MTQEEKDKLIEKLNQMVELSNKSITIWTKLMEQCNYPKKVCLEQININNQEKEACFKIIRKYDTYRN